MAPPRGASLRRRGCLAERLRSFVGRRGPSVPLEQARPDNTAPMFLASAPASAPSQKNAVSPQSCPGSLTKLRTRLRVSIGTGTTQNFARKRPRCLAVRDHRDAVHQHPTHPLAELVKRKSMSFRAELTPFRVIDLRARSSASPARARGLPSSPPHHRGPRAVRERS